MSPASQARPGEHQHQDATAGHELAPFTSECVDAGRSGFPSASAGENGALFGL